MNATEAPAEDALPRILVFVLAIGCGLFLALTTHIALTSAGIGLAAPWQDLFPIHGQQLKAALAWWAIAISGCMGSFVVVLLLRARPSRGPGGRILRLGAGIFFFCLLAVAGHAVATAPAASLVATAATNLAAMSLGGFMALCTAHFALAANRAKP